MSACRMRGGSCLPRLIRISHSSDYLNITLQSTIPISVRIISIPECITITVHSTSGQTAAGFTIGGLAPSTTYYRYQDGLHRRANRSGHRISLRR
jgi:hypothetical protein